MRIKLICLLAVLTMTAGCATPYIMPTYLDENKAEQLIIPIGTVLDEYEIVDVVLIHGMCAHDGYWALKANNLLVQSLGSPDRIEKEQLPAAIKGPFDNTVVYKFINKVRGKTLRTYAILWSPANDNLKKKLCYDRCNNTNGCGSEHFSWKRGAINGVLKSNLLDDCLADAVIYSGANGNKIRTQVRDAVQYILKDRQLDASGQTVPPLFFVSESLGSKILFDALVSLLHDTNSRILALKSVSSTIQVFMEANQIPLLSLATLEVKEDKKVNPLDDSFNEFAREFNKLSEPTTLKHFRKTSIPQKMLAVSFTDPNDLLSYTLQKSYLSEKKEYEVLDVLISNATTWLWLLENPYKAHTGYQENPEVLRVIACGYKGKWHGCPQ